MSSWLYHRASRAETFRYRNFCIIGCPWYNMIDLLYTHYISLHVYSISVCQPQSSVLTPVAGTSPLHQAFVLARLLGATSPLLPSFTFGGGSPVVKSWCTWPRQTVAQEFQDPSDFNTTTPSPFATNFLPTRCPTRNWSWKGLFG